MTVTYLRNFGVLMKGVGLVSRSDIMSANNEIYSSPASIQKIRYILCDFTNIGDFQVSNDDIKFLADQDKAAAEINPNMIIAIVAEKDLIFGSSRMWEAHSFNFPFESMVFRNIKDAEKWIDEKTEKP